MLDAETKRRIDTARDILVGKVPDPKSQVEQITIALIYKFMDDIDSQSEELGGERSFFAGDFARYGWARLMRSGLGGHDILNLYAEAITRMPENPGIPPLFRDIFNNAYLPYRDPETLRAFLKVIDEFEYDHSERLGDAFEYLLSVMGAQGDAGQFRTPRHVIDFIVAVIDPKKDETVLDPACGTAGFLISSYKHILAANTDADGQSTLTPDEKGRLAGGFSGYDISPDMVRLSLVNMYLHGFADPHIQEYDTLTSDERWNEYADVILANPPFMSPKGGIRPHNRFSVTSRRSEVLFVDYMAEHLTPSGRAGIIVPEGIIFQSQKAHTRLRKMLVEEFLVAVVSLPAGVFKPYSGVKTSILILDRALARRTDRIAFFKVENDGFDLGDQRRPIDKNDLPQTAEVLKQYLNMDEQDIQDGEIKSSSSCPSMLDELIRQGTALIVAKEKIAATGDYNLSGERYREDTIRNHDFPLVSLGDATLFRVESGGTPKSSVEEYWNGGVSWATLVDLPPTNFITEIDSTVRTISERGLRESSAKLIPRDSVLVSTRATIGRIAINRIRVATNQGFKNVIVENRQRVSPEYVALALTKLVSTMKAWASGWNFQGDFEVQILPTTNPPAAAGRAAGDRRRDRGLPESNRRRPRRNRQTTAPTSPSTLNGRWSDLQSRVSMQPSDKVMAIHRKSTQTRPSSYIEGIRSLSRMSHAIGCWDTQRSCHLEIPLPRRNRGVHNDDVLLSTVRPNDVIMSCSGTLGRKDESSERADCLHPAFISAASTARSGQRSLQIGRSRDILGRLWIARSIVQQSMEKSRIMGQLSGP